MTDRPLEDFFTPEDCARQCARRLVEVMGPEHDAQFALEPSAGGGAFTRALAEFLPGLHLTALDIQGGARLMNSAADAFEVGDFLKYRGDYDVICGNPPFKPLVQHVLHALSLLKSGGHLGFMLPLATLGGGGRIKALWSKPGFKHFAVIHPRPFPTLREPAFFIWQKDYTGPTSVGSPIVWTPKTQAAA